MKLNLYTLSSKHYRVTIITQDNNLILTNLPESNCTPAIETESLEEGIKCIEMDVHSQYS